MATTPISVLRPTLRVIHCLQKERGTSCATSAAISGPRSETTNQDGGVCIEALGSTLRLVESQVSFFEIETSVPNNSSVVRVLAHQLQQARLDTDLALAKLKTFLDSEYDAENMVPPSVRSVLTRLKGSASSICGALEKVRSLIPLNDEQEHQNPNLSNGTITTNLSSGKKVTFHRIYVAYNALVCHVINDIIKHQMNEFELLQQQMEAKLVPRRDSSFSPVRRLESSSKLTDMMIDGADIALEAVGLDKQPIGRVRCYTGDIFADPLDRSDIVNSNKPTSNHRRGNSLGIPFMVETMSDRPKHRRKSSDLSSNKIDPTMYSVRKTSALFKLLFSFVQLKESTGTERAFLFALLAMPTPSETVKGSNSYGSLTSEVSTSEKELEHIRKKRETLYEHHELLFNNLVMEIENSRSILKEVQLQAKKVALLDRGYHEKGGIERINSSPLKSTTKISGSWLLDLVQEVLQPSKAFRDVQNLIRRDFDLLSFRKAVTMEQFWGLLTVYIEKLHSLELLIIEELESSYEHTMNNQAMSSVSEQLIQPAAEDGSVDPSSCDQEATVSNLKGASELSIGELLLQLFGSDDKKCSSSDKINIQGLIHSLSADDIKTAMLSLIKKEQVSQKRKSICVEKSISEVDEALKGADFFDDDEAKPQYKHVENEWEIGLYEVKFLRRIGKGAAGTTYFGKWRGEPVALKVASTSALGVEGWSAEIETLTHLHHPNVIRMLGCINNEAPLTRCLVLEYCDGGDLENALLKPAPHNLFFRAAYGLANGMAYLHNRKIIHRDIKPSNVLIHGDYSNGNFVVKLTDFGVATKMKEASRSNYTAETGTYRWMAPEVIRHEAYSSKADVYSFSLLLWQLLTREEPFAPQSQLAAAGMVAIEQGRPPVPSGTPISMQALIERCWNDDEEVRPQSEEISNLLQKVEKSLTDEDKFWLSMPMGHQVYLFSEEASEREQKRRQQVYKKMESDPMSASDLSLAATDDSDGNSPLRRLSSKMGFGHGQKSKGLLGKPKSKKLSLWRKKRPNDSVKLMLKDRASCPYL